MVILSLEQTVNMKTTFIFLACLLVMTTGRYTHNSDNKEKDCNNKAKEISSQDCKQQCDVAELTEDCAKCIEEHKDYDRDCKIDNNLQYRCLITVFPLQKEEEGCREECQWDNTKNGYEDVEACRTCTMNHQDAGLNCRIIMGYLIRYKKFTI